MIKYLTVVLLLSLAGISFANWPEHSPQHSPQHVPETPETLHYWGERIMILRLQPHGTMVEVKVWGNAYLTPVRDNSTFSVYLGVPSITVHTSEGKYIDLLECESQFPLREYLSRPFLAVFNKNGVMEKIEIDYDEDNLSANLKRSITNHFQMSISQLTGEKPSVELAPKVTGIGVCPVRAELLKNEHGRQLVKSSADFSNCTRVREDNRSGNLTCLGQTCRATEEKNLNWFSTLDSWTAKINDRFVLERSQTKQWGKYNPYKESDQEISWNLNIEAHLLAIARINVPLFVGEKTDTVNRPHFPKIDKGICESKEANGLTKMYGAVVCEQEFSFMYEDIIARAIECS